MKKIYEEPVVNMQNILLEQVIAGSTPVGPADGTTPTVTDWDEDGAGIGDNWGASQEWKW